MNNINTYFDKIFIINLHYRGDRLEPLLKRLEDNGITNYKVIDGYVGDMFKRVNFARMFSFKHNALGCLFSHLRCMHEAIHNEYERILILEDDVLLHKDFNNQFDTIIGGVDEDWDLLYLGHQTITQFTDKMNTHEQFFEKGEHIFKAHNSWGGHAYGLSKKLMTFTYEHITGKNPVCWEEIDAFYVRRIQDNKDFKSLKVYPQLFIQDVIKSDNTSGSREYFKTMLNMEYSTFKDYI